MPGRDPRDADDALEATEWAGRPNPEALSNLERWMSPDDAQAVRTLHAELETGAELSAQLLEKDPTRWKRDIQDPLWKRVHARIKPLPSGCWRWLPPLSSSTGYGQIMVQGRQWGAHRLVYVLYKGELPDGLPLDHLCRNTWCVNPDHLEPVTTRENVLRGDTIPARNLAKTHCPQGHPYDETNTYRAPQGGRHCRTCMRERDRRRRHPEEFVSGDEMVFERLRELDEDRQF